MNATCASQAYVVPGLLEGLDYMFRVRAENRLGFGPFTETAEPVRARDPICKKHQLLWPNTQNIYLPGSVLIIFFLYLLLRPTWPPNQAESQPGNKDHSHFELGAPEKQRWLSCEALRHWAFELGHQREGEGDMEAVQQERRGGAHLCGGGSEGGQSIFLTLFLNLSSWNL